MRRIGQLLLATGATVGVVSFAVAPAAAAAPAAPSLAGAQHEISSGVADGAQRLVGGLVNSPATDGLGGIDGLVNLGN